MKKRQAFGEMEMGESPLCVENSVKKGRWMPHEDIILVSYIQKHGPGNWKSVPANAGLLRCPKSCRDRWNHHLRSDINHGNITEIEEQKIIELKAFFENSWARIAYYMPGRTINDIKNYWNTHIKKKIMEIYFGHSQGLSSSVSTYNWQWERKPQVDINKASQGLSQDLSFDEHSTLSGPQSSDASNVTVNAIMEEVTSSSRLEN